MKTPMLDRIKVMAEPSQETPCFTARLKVDGKTFTVINRGSGGCNEYSPFLSRELEAELDEWAAANNPPCEMQGYPPLPMNFETWTFGKAFDLCAS